MSIHLRRLCINRLTIEIRAKNNVDLHKVKKSSIVYSNKLIIISSLFKQECIIYVCIEKNHLQTIVITHVVYLNNNAWNELELFFLHLCCFGWGATYNQSPKATHHKKDQNVDAPFYISQISTFNLLSWWKERSFDSWWWVNMPLFYNKLYLPRFNTSTLNYLKYIKMSSYIILWFGKASHQSPIKNN